MADDAGRGGSVEVEGDGAGGSSIWTWLVPVLAFVSGVILGGVVIGVGNLAGDDEADVDVAVTQEPTEPAGPEPTSTDSDLVVQVPAVCIEAAEQAEAAARYVDDVVAAVRDFDARALQDLVDRFETLQPEVQDLAQECQRVAQERGMDGNLVTSTPAPVVTP